MTDSKVEAPVEEKSFFKVIVHSFFIIPFLIAVFCVVLFAAINLLTQEKKTAYDYLSDVKTGSMNKRWQAAFELSKILANPKLLPEKENFYSQLSLAYEKAQHDDDRVRQYLALAMGRTGRQEFVAPLLTGLNDKSVDNLVAAIYSLGMLKDPKALPSLYKFVDHSDARVRSTAIVAIGNIGSVESKDILHKALSDTEVNVQWGAALSLARIGDWSAKETVLKLLDRKYLSQFKEVDQDEQTNLILATIVYLENVDDPEIKTQLKKLSETDQNMKVRSAALKALQ